ncbi:fungal-specific transcription factor domain-containing protein [Aspergillus karnatakaensis]|uniref:fungal specific transcription factor domain-containing protein n=1 Tax=Aspergillus karnatakaensis TaxID=1810916 RepID=UPI003CCCB2F6
MDGSRSFHVNDFDTSEVHETLTSDELGSALQVLPPRIYLDALVESYLSGPNYQYYILYPPSFSKDYTAWWDDRVRGRTPDRAMTCLLLRICACATLAATDTLRNMLETELGENIAQLSKRYHIAARTLSSSIGAGKGGLLQVQQLFLTSWWLKGDGQFIDSWHSLAASIHEAQELGLHDKDIYQPVDEFEEEMRRRVWCILYVCDRLFYSLLSRPRIIEATTTTPLDLPDLHLGTAGKGQDWPSPITHVVLLCQLFQPLSAEFVSCKNRDLPPNEIVKLQRIVSNWLAACPTIYKTTDKPRDDEPPYIQLQRWTIQVPAYLLMLQALKPYLAATPGQGLRDSETHRRLQAAAVECALSLADSSTRLAEATIVYVTNFHTAVFTLFDGIAVLCSSILHDSDGSLPQRAQVIEAVGRGVQTMKRLSEISRTAITAYRVLSQLVRRLGLPCSDRGGIESAEADGLIPRNPAQRTTIGPDKSSGLALESPELHGLDGDESESASVRDLQLGQLGEMGMWNWGPLGFDL